MDVATFVDHAPMQDRDLLLRLSMYFDAVDVRLRQGQGWFIFNARGGRSRRISTFIQLRLAEHTPPVSHYLMPWRDFALSAYVTQEALPVLAPDVAADARIREEFDLAARITSQTWTQMLSTDLLVLVGLKPSNRHEAELLDRTLTSRHDQRLATILLAPDMPQELAAELQTADPAAQYWDRIFQRMYDTSLVAL
ncbi:MAG: hypothetical protein M3464_04965 [Chloroflexota bacterium]|nr:hypothetical protein [Chloroflexota bacterium]